MNNENNSMDALLAEYDVKRIKSGDILKGKVIEVNDKEVTVNIDYAFDGLITKEEVSYDDVSPVEILKKDDIIDVYVISPNDGEGLVQLSRIRALEVTEKEDIKNAFKNEETLDVKVKEVVKGGLVANYGSVRVFIPASQVSRERVELEDYVGKTLTVKIIELDFRNRKVVGSRRVIEEAEYAKEKKIAWSKVKSGEKRTGVVTKIVKFGAFVDIGGIQGLIHLNDLSWERVHRAEDVVSVGDKVEVFVGDVDKEKERLSLILKDVDKEPWKVNSGELNDGDVLEGKVVRLTSFGAFVQLKPGIEGLVHISEITDENIAKPSDVLKVDDTVKVKIINMDRENKRIALSIKDADEKSKEYLQYNDDEEGITLGDLFKDFKFE